jgi:hypothetical protein
MIRVTARRDFTCGAGRDKPRIGACNLPSACFRLVVGQTHRVQECVPPRVAVEIFEEGIFEQIAQTGVVLPARSFQPFESLVLVPPIRVSLGNLERG